MLSIRSVVPSILPFQPQVRRQTPVAIALSQLNTPLTHDMVRFSGAVEPAIPKQRRTLFPPIEPYNTFRLKVPGGHELYVEEVGNPNGEPVVYLHGGPGGGLSPKFRQFFDPNFYRIILFDQRGTGKSTPHASLKNNTTWDLLADIERIRKKLGIKQWMVYGGSWGSTLALAYAETHPSKVSGLILRGIFLTRPEEILWFYQEGASHLFPDEWEKFIEPIPPEERHDMLRAYYKRLTDPDERVRLRAARAWAAWESRLLYLLPQAEKKERTRQDDLDDLAISRIEAHYFVNNSFFKPNQLLNNIHRIRHIPTWIVQGRYDVVCPPTSAWDLHRAFPEAKFNLVPDAGHASLDPGITDGLVEATEEFKAMRLKEKAEKAATV